jgi:hypothetical protein
METQQRTWLTEPLWQDAAFMARFHGAFLAAALFLAMTG